MGKFILGLLLALLVIAGCGYYIYRTTGYTFGLDSTILSKGTINLTTQDIVNGGKIPADFTCDGRNISPTFLLDHIPSDAKSLVIVLDDADSTPKYFTHWLAFNIGPWTTSVESSKVLGNAIVGVNDFGNNEYDGPCPPAGETHKYYFRIYALDTMLNLNQEAQRKGLDSAMNGHIIGKGELTAEYSKVAN
jgi:Raf kinase inhibitor-like YbhB/YbcL family protein